VERERRRRRRRMRLGDAFMCGGDGDGT